MAEPADVKDKLEDVCDCITSLLHALCQAGRRGHREAQIIERGLHLFKVAPRRYRDLDGDGDEALGLSDAARLEIGLRALERIAAATAPFYQSKPFQRGLAESLSYVCIRRVGPQFAEYPCQCEECAPMDVFVCQWCQSDQLTYMRGADCSVCEAQLCYACEGDMMCEVCESVVCFECNRQRLEERGEPVPAMPPQQGSGYRCFDCAQTQYECQACGKHCDAAQDGRSFCDACNGALCYRCMVSMRCDDCICTLCYRCNAAQFEQHAVPVPPMPGNEYRCFHCATKLHSSKE